MAEIKRTGDAPRERRTWGEWPSAVGDLVIRTLVATEPCPPGWTEWRDEQGQRCAWKIWTGPEPIGGDPDAVWAVRPTVSGETGPVTPDVVATGSVLQGPPLASWALEPDTEDDVLDDAAPTDREDPTDA